jgi:hypothetical protein
VHAATADGHENNDPPHIPDVPTIYNRLENASVAWKIYFHDMAQAHTLLQLSTHLDHFHFYAQFRADCQSGTLFLVRPGGGAGSATWRQCLPGSGGGEDLSTNKERFAPAAHGAITPSLNARRTIRPSFGWAARKHINAAKAARHSAAEMKNTRWKTQCFQIKQCCSR